VLQYIGFTLTSDSKTVTRRIYSLFDMLGDVGGLNDALVLITSVILSGFTPAWFDVAKAKAIFKYRTD